MQDSYSPQELSLLEEAAAALLPWYQAHRRALPWRDAPSPYHVWLSEIMLQQTRVEAVRPYYARFLQVAPDIAALAALPDDRLMKLWEGLGYYSRARNLKRAAQVLCREHGGQMPSDPAALRRLPGIGDYTAGAIASIAFDRAEPAVDGNVLRILARLLADDTDVLSPAAKKKATALLRAVYASRQAPGDHAALTQAWMELGQTVCLPQKAPRCDACPLAPLCLAYRRGTVSDLPVRQGKQARRTCHLLVLVLRTQEGTYAVRQRAPEGLLAGLWELPNAPLPGPLEEGDCMEAAADLCRQMGVQVGEMAMLPPARHLFTHLEWQMVGVFCNGAVVAPPRDAAVRFVPPAMLRQAYPLPAAFRSFLRVIFAEEARK